MTNRARTIIIALVIIVVCLLFVLGVLVGAAVVSWRSAVRAGNEAATVQNIKTIAAVEVQYFDTHNRTFGTLDQLVSEQMLSSRFAGDPTMVDGYVFILSVAHNPEGSSSWYKITADPQDESQGWKHYYFDSDDRRIRANAERQAGHDDPFNKE